MPSKEMIRQHLLAAAERREMAPFTEICHAVVYALEKAAQNGTTPAQERVLDRFESVMIEISHFFDGYSEEFVDRRDRLEDAE